MKLNSVVIQTVFKVVNYQYIQPKLQLKFKFRLKGFFGLQRDSNNLDIEFRYRILSLFPVSCYITYTGKQFLPKEIVYYFGTR